MEAKNNFKEMIRGRKTCQSSLCRIMVPILVLLILVFGTVTLIDSFHNTRGKKFVVLQQQGVELHRIALEPWKNKISEVPVWYKGKQYHLKIEINGGAARLIDDTSGSRKYPGEEKNHWIYDYTDSFSYEPLKLTLYFE